MDCKRIKIGVALAVVCGVFLSCGSCFVAQVAAQDESSSSKTQSVTEQIERATDKVNKNQVYQIKYKLKKGEEIRWNFEHVVTTKFQMAGEVEESSSRSENVKLWKVANVDQLGNITFAYTIESVKMWQQVGDTDPVSYDSKTDNEIPQEYAGTADEVGKPLAIFSIAPNGTILDRKSNLKQDVFGVGKVTIPLPEKAVPVGYEWNVPIVLSANDENGTKKLKARIHYELAKVKENKAYIRFKTEVLTPVKSEKIKSTIMQKMTKGIVVFDMELGRPVLQQVQWDEKAQGFEGADSYLKYVARMSEKIIFNSNGKTAAIASKLTPSGGGEVVNSPVDIKTRDSDPIMRK
ncbi:MAG: hypothetical protein ACR2NK_03530 [Mariniblastus sp.]